MDLLLRPISVARLSVSSKVVAIPVVVDLLLRPVEGEVYRPLPAVAIPVVVDLLLRLRRPLKWRCLL